MSRGTDGYVLHRLLVAGKIEGWQGNLPDRFSLNKQVFLAMILAAVRARSPVNPTEINL